MPDSRTPGAGRPLHAGLGQASARSLLFTVLAELVYADPARPIPTAALTDVLALLGVSEHAARQAIARAASAGWITSERDGRRTLWRLSPSTNSLLEAGQSRVFALTAPQPPWDGQWLSVLLGVSLARGAARNRLESGLRWAGFGSPVSNVWITPHTDREQEARQIITAEGLAESALSMIGRPAGIGMPLDEAIRRAWDLDAVAASHTELLARFAGREADDSDESLVGHLELTDALRRFPYMDPQLPMELLPDWIGRRAATVLRDLRRQWASAAHRRWQSLLDAHGAPAPYGPTVNRVGSHRA
ncbi:MAG TPA: PaaX family transcriptional regulator C-terminal domain-containing protein [Pseudonocardiaceae bacterium]|nr:PaaX family transcriptional regulator C-terminal domain-containing protein [Pseudonocardiaceae bacterium]